MKNTISAILAIVMCLGLTACGGSRTSAEIITPEPSPVPAEQTNVLDDDTLTTLLTSTFTLDGFDTLVNVEDGTATVILTSDAISQAYLQASSGDKTAIEQWDDLVASFLKLHNTAKEFVSERSANSLTTIIVSKDNFPYISITDGIVEVDFLHLSD